VGAAARHRAGEPGLLLEVHDCVVVVVDLHDAELVAIAQSTGKVATLACALLLMWKSIICRTSMR
jgi:hypothetical protein